MIRILGAAMVLLSSSAYGYIKSQVYSERLKQLRILQEILLGLSGDIGFGSISLSESLERIAKQVPQPFSCFLNDISYEMGKREGKSLSEIIRGHATQVVKHSALKEKDLECLIRVGDTVGNQDRKTQTHLIELHLKELESVISEVSDSIYNRQKLCRMFGVVSGILIVIMLL